MSFHCIRGSFPMEKANFIPLMSSYPESNSVTFQKAETVFIFFFPGIIHPSILFCFFVCFLVSYLYIIKINANKHRKSVRASFFFFNSRICRLVFFPSSNISLFLSTPPLLFLLPHLFPFPLPPPLGPPSSFSPSPSPSPSSFSASCFLLLFLFPLPPTFSSHSSNVGSLARVTHLAKFPGGCCMFQDVTHDRRRLLCQEQFGLEHWRVEGPRRHGPGLREHLSLPG